jgi:hypothetical protein
MPRKRSLNRLALLKTPKFLGLVFLLFLILVLLEITNTTHLLHNKNSKLTPVTAGQSTKGEQLRGSNKHPTQSGQASSSGDSKSPNGGRYTNSNALLTTPRGDFVSNHRPSLSSNMPEASVCNTTPGASCQIQFIKGSIVKSLPIKITDRNGATYWSWQPSKIGFSEGSWQIQANATLGDQVKTTWDALTLQVGP